MSTFYIVILVGAAIFVTCFRARTLEVLVEILKSLGFALAIIAATVAVEFWELFLRISFGWEGFRLLERIERQQDIVFFKVKLARADLHIITDDKKVQASPQYAELKQLYAQARTAGIWKWLLRKKVHLYPEIANEL